MSAIDKVLSIAKAEVGYLEKRSNSNLYDKTANAGDANYTKYWAEIKPSYQGQPWCACFVTWVFVQAFGQEKATKLLKHYPYVYCPTMASLFTLNANPKVGDIVIFYRNGTFAHTGIVTGVNGDYFTTIEGNTSGGSTIIANGGGVCAKGYYNSNLPGTKFVTPDWSIVETPFTWNETPVNLIGNIRASELNIRNKPTTDSDIIGKHSMGDQVMISAKTDNGWYRVDYPNIGKGYISAEYVATTVPVVEEDLSPEEFSVYLSNYLAQRAAEAPSDWSASARKYCEDEKIIVGDEHGNKNYKAFLTREELAQMLYNLHNGGFIK